MKRICIFVFLLSLVSCSHTMIDAVDNVRPNVRLKRSITTKSGSEIDDLAARKALHRAQSNHLTILMHGIRLKDSVYVQTLSQEEMARIGITDEELDFSRRYLEELNKGLN